MSYLQLSRDQAQQLVQFAWNTKPYECCGLIAGQDNQAKTIIPIPNASDKPNKRFFMEPSALLKALKQIEYERLQLLAIFHSHPEDDPIPSQTDIHESQYSEVVHLIISLKYQTPRLQAWRIKASQVSAVDLVIGSKPQENLEKGNLTQTQKYAIVLAALLAFIAVIVISIVLLPPAPTLPINGS